MSRPRGVFLDIHCDHRAFGQSFFALRPAIYVIVLYKLNIALRAVFCLLCAVLLPGQPGRRRLAQTNNNGKGPRNINQWKHTKHMKTNLTLLIGAAALALAVPARADITLTFEGLQDLEPIDNYYNGGTGGFGSGPGANYGITFTSDSLAIVSSLAGGTGNFQNNPSGNTVAFFLSGPGDLMNVAGGFTSGFSFYYSSVNVPGNVSVWSGPNGTGTELASLSLPTTPRIPGLPTAYNDWLPVGVSFSGTAESVDFAGTADQIGFDNITLGSQIPSRPVNQPPSGPVNQPEPAQIISGLFVAGLGGLSLVVRRLRNRR